MEEPQGTAPQQPARGNGRWVALAAALMVAVALALTLLRGGSPLRLAVQLQPTGRADELPADCAGHRSPVVVLAHNNPSLLRPLVRQLLDCFGAEVIVVDMGSNFPPMLAYLEELAAVGETVVHRLDNLGPRGLFLPNTSGIIRALPRFFAMTDSDIRLGDNMPRNFLCTLAHLTQRLGVPKAALALDLSDFDRMWQTAKYYRDTTVLGTEDGFFAHALPVPGMPGLEGVVFDASADTIFSVYDKAQMPCGRDDYSGAGAPCFTAKAVRIGGPYLAKHRPWYPEGECCPRGAGGRSC